MTSKNETLVFEHIYNAPVEKVWKAITNVEDMKQWYFDLPGFKPEVGFEFSFKGGPEDGVQYIHLCKITEVVSHKKLSYTWRYEGYEGNSLVTFELLPEGKDTRVMLSHSGLHTFPTTNKDFAKENFEAGWTMITGTLLKDFLEKN